MKIKLLIIFFVFYIPFAQGSLLKSAGDVISKAGDAVTNTVQQAGNTVTNTVQQVGNAVNNTAQQAADVVNKTAEEAGKVGNKTTEELGKVTDKTAKEAGNYVTDSIKTVTTGQPHGDLAKTVAKAIDDSGKETERAGDNINDAAVAAGHFLENQAQSYGESLSEAEKRVREGKLVDAIWHVSTDPLKHTEKNFGVAVTESSLLNDVATATASVYGGPAGAAAYAAWITYKRTGTGDLELALKAGLIAGATNQGLQIVNGMPSGTNAEMFKKTLASASIGGAAVAASGGGEKEIIEAFVKGAALTAAREQYKNTTHQEIEGKVPTQSAVAKEDPSIKVQFKVLVDDNGNPILDSNGHEQLDIRSMPRNISHVGLQTDNPNAGVFSGAETSEPMQLIAKIPYANDMAYYHDQWMAITQKSGVEVQATILPAAILTVAGSDTPIINQATNENIDNSNKDK